MSTQCFLRKASEVATCDQVSLGTNAAPLGGGNSAWSAPLPLRTTRGGGLATTTGATIGGPVGGIEVDDAGAVPPYQWISPPIDADVTISGTITVNLWSSESNMSANVAINAIIERLDSTGAIVSTIANTARTTELAVTTRAVNNFTVTPTSTAMNKGDRIRIRVYGDDAGTMGSGFTFDLGYAGTTAAADGDSYVTFTETFGFLTTDPTTTTVYPTTVASDVNSGVDEREAWTSRGASSTAAAKAKAIGFSAPEQLQISGANVEWFTKQLSAFTLVGPVLVNAWCILTGGNDAESIRAEIAVCASDGSSPVVWAGTTHPEKVTTTGAMFNLYVAGDDLAVTDGQRLRIRFYCDDASIGAPTLGTRPLNLKFNGATANADGDVNLTFGQTLTEFVTASGGLSATTDTRLRTIGPVLVPSRG